MCPIQSDWSFSKQALTSSGCSVEKNTLNKTERQTRLLEMRKVKVSRLFVASLPAFKNPIDGGVKVV